MPRNSIDTKQRILDAANHLFYSHGIRAVSVDAVAEKAGITKKSIYYHFKSKDDLVTAYLKSRDQPNLDAFRMWFERAEGGLPEKTLAIFEGVAKATEHPKWRGCGFLRTIGELADKPGHPAVKAGAAHKKRFEQWLEDIFAAAKVEAPATLARRVVVLMDGAFTCALIHRDSNYVLEAGRLAQQLVLQELPV